MNYEPNKIRWNPGDIVIHDADNKSPYMLMMVVGYLKDGRCETRYLNPRTTTMQRRFANRLDVLHDPKRFEIDIDHVPISALTDISDWQAKLRAKSQEECSVCGQRVMRCLCKTEDLMRAKGTEV